MNKSPEILDAVSHETLTPEQMSRIVEYVQSQLPTAPSHVPTPLCQDGKPCQTPSSGGPCTQCGYPIAYAHPTRLLDAFDVEAIWIGGTAILVKPQSNISPNVVRIFSSDHSWVEHPIPKTPEVEQAPTDQNALIGPPNIKVSVPDIKVIVQTLLQEGPRNRPINGPGLAIDDNRPNLNVVCATLGPFEAPLSLLRIALLPGEAEHVELYDIRVGEGRDAPIGTSVISRLPGYGPEAVREIPKRVDIGGTLIGRYLPGAALAGQLRGGANAVQPAELSPGDLLGGVWVDLGRTFPPMSCVHLFYRVAPGHVFCAVVEPIRDETTTGEP